jgi:dienelactone hydrolase
MDRRRVLAALAGVGSGGLAGCVGFDGLGDVSRNDPTVHAPAAASVTESLDVAVTGLGGDSPVWVEASTDDGSGSRWFGRGLFEPAAGRVDLRDAAPVRGTYDDPGRMGLFWSMQPEDLSRDRYDSDHRTQSVTLRVVPDERETAVATTTVDRRVAHPNSGETDVETPIVGTLVESPDDGPAPGVVLFHGSSGNRALTPARALASRGFVVLALQYVSPAHPSLPDDLVEVPVEYADRAVEWLARHETTTDDPIGLGGFSRGGELALLVATRHEVSAVVNWVGAALVFNAVVLTDDRTVSPDSPDTSAWAVGGEPLPHPSREEFDPERDPTAAYRRWLEATPDETLRAAEIPLEAVEAPILLVSGGDDGVWPSRYLLNRATTRLEAMDYPYRFEHRTYDDAGHGIGVPVLPTWANRPSGPFGGTLAGTAAAEDDSWPRAVGFFGEGVNRQDG